MLSRRATTVVIALCATIGSLAVFAQGAYALPAPGWEVSARSFPTVMSPGETGMIIVTPYNIGAAETSGTISVTDVLPAGLAATYAGGERLSPQHWNCEGAKVVRCTNNPATLPGFPGGAGICAFAGLVQTSHRCPPIEIEVAVAAGASAQTLTNRVAVSGGEAPTGASTTDPVRIGSDPAGFGISDWDVWFSNEDGTIDTQAGSHPYAATFDVQFNAVRNEFIVQGGHLATQNFRPAGGDPRTVTVELPPGFVGDPTAVPQCPREDLDQGTTGETICPSDTVVGMAAPTANPIGTDPVSVYNMVPPPGVAAEFAFSIIQNSTLLDAGVRTGGDDGITTTAANASQHQVLGAVVTLWGVPGAASHDEWRCEIKQLVPCAPEGTAGTKPFLTLPTACGAPAPFTIRATEWQDPTAEAESTVLSHDSNGVPTGFTGCEDLSFGPLLTTSPDTSDADTPAGLTAEVKPQLGGLDEPGGDSASDIQNTTVTLPPGLVINPGQAAGLQACQPGEDGLTSEAEKAEGQENDGPASCPNASKVGTVEIETPLLPHSLKGDVFVMQSDPPEIKLLVTASGEGVNLKLVGVVHLNEQTGQLTTTFEGTPELPFTDFRLSFSGGAQAALDTPAQCGIYTTNAAFDPWSAPYLADFETIAQFGLSAGPGGGPCPSASLPFSPTLTAGSTTDQAGAFTGFSMLLQREDGQQRIEKLQFRAPPGLAGMISSVPLCGEPQAAQGTCPSASHVGHTVVTSGPGPYPLVVPQPGEPEAGIYLTGPYEGAPFGLSIVTPVIAGPFNLGTIVTRAKIEIDPHTAQVIVTTDPLPQIVKGVPTDIRSVDAVIDRPGFMFNPTNCESSSFSGTAWGTPPPGAGGAGATAAIGSHFGVGSCRELAFKPTFTTSTKAKGSKASGAALSFKISYPKGAMGSESWFNEAQFDIPKQLPARLSTLQQSCLAATFETNRAACPKASIIGHAVVHTPVLPDPLEGPVYFVSYGSARFPDAVLDLRGDNVHIELHGETFISKTSVTSATFRNTPDVPFESIEVNVPTGPYSEFGANLPPKDNYDFCGQKLTMPTFFKAQNGLEIHQETPVTISGCAKPKKAKKASKKHTKASSHTHKG
jgi:hypothetical protein